jgi:hypothetical protein
MRVTFLGREIDHRPFALSAPASGWTPSFATTAESVEEADVVVAFAPGDVDAAALKDRTGALTLAVVDDAGFAPGVEDGWSAATLPAAALPSGFDRVIATDPLLARAGGAWRSALLPVDDALFCAVEALGSSGPHTPPRLVTHGEGTTWRSFWLPDLVEHYGLVQVTPGAPFADAYAAADVALCLRADHNRSEFPAHALLHLAAGRLLITEPLRPPRGLEPGLDHLEVREPIDALHVLHQVRRRPAAFDHVRIRARIRMEQYRASVVWPRILADLKADVAAYAP